MLRRGCFGDDAAQLYICSNAEHVAGGPVSHTPHRDERSALTDSDGIQDALGPIYFERAYDLQLSNMTDPTITLGN